MLIILDVIVYSSVSGGWMDVIPSYFGLLLKRSAPDESRRYVATQQPFHTLSRTFFLPFSKISTVVPLCPLSSSVGSNELAVPPSQSLSQI